MTVTHHKPLLKDKDLFFLQITDINNMSNTKLFETKMKPMFPEDTGYEEIRSTIHFFEIKWKN